MVTISKTGGPGLRFENEVVRLEVNDAGGVSRADVLILELVDGAYSKVAKSTSAVSQSEPYQLVGVAMEDGVNGQKVRVGLRGVFVVLCDSGVTALSNVHAGGAARSLVKKGTNPTSSGTEYRKVVGVALEAADGDYLTKVLFDGITGFACTAGTVEE